MPDTVPTGSSPNETVFTLVANWTRLQSSRFLGALFAAGALLVAVAIWRVRFPHPALFAAATISLVGAWGLIDRGEHHTIATHPHHARAWHAAQIVFAILAVLAAIMTGLTAMIPFLNWAPNG